MRILDMMLKRTDIRRKMAAALCAAIVAQTLPWTALPTLAEPDMPPERDTQMETPSEPIYSETETDKIESDKTVESPSDAALDSVATVTVDGYLIFMSEKEPKPSSVKLQLYVNGRPDGSKKASVSQAVSDDPDSGEAYAEREISLEETGFPVWSYTFGDLPVYDAEGNAYEYGVWDSSCQTATPSQALYYRDENQMVSGGGEDAGTMIADLVYVERTSVEGAYIVEANGGKLPYENLVQVEALPEEEDNAAWMDEGTTGYADAKAGIWRVDGCPRYNPETGAELTWRARLAENDPDYAETYENQDLYEYETESAYPGGIIRNTYQGGGTFRVAGNIRWEDENDRALLRPEDASFIRIYNEKEEDVTNLATVTAAPSEADAAVWEYEIGGLSREETYRLEYPLLHYAVNEEAMTAVSAGEGEYVFAPELTETLKTRTAYGNISWSDKNALIKRPEDLSFMKVYQGTRDVTDEVALTLTADGATDNLWGYNLSGLADGVEYTIKLDEVEGYMIAPSEIRIPAANSMYRSMNRALPDGALEGITMEARASRNVTIKNVTYAKSSAAIAEFEYLVKVGESPYNGSYTVRDNDDETSSESRSTENGTIKLKKNQQAAIFATDGNALTVTQTLPAADVKTTILFEETEQSLTVSSADTALTFTNTQKVTADIRKIWNDNENENNKRPTTEMDLSNFKENVNLWYQIETGEWQQVTEDNMDVLGLTAVPKPTELRDTTGGSSRWMVIFDYLPYTTRDGKEIHYKASDSWENYHAEAYEKDSTSEVEKDFPYIINTGYKKFNATKKWVDNKNGYQTRPSKETFQEKLELWRADEAGNKTKIDMPSADGKENILILADAPVDSDSVSESWNIQVTNLVAYDPSGRPYTYYLKETDDSMAIDAGTNLTSPEGVKYEAKYENTGNYSAKNDGCYEAGILTNTLVGTADYVAHKKWQDELETDEEKNAQRPDGTLQLWRYPRPTAEDTSSGPDSATQVGVAIALQKKSNTYDFVASDFIGADASLPRFDISGREFVYFVREKLTGGGYQQFLYGVDGTTLKSDTLVYNGETLCNRRSGTTSVAVTKTWKCAAFQGIDAKVVLQLQSRRKKPAGEPWTDVTGKTMTIEDFRAETLTKTGTFSGLSQFDEAGREYEYSAREAGIKIKNSAGEFVEVQSDVPAPGYFTTADGRYSFKMDRTAADPSQIELTNSLTGEIEVTIKKTWSSGWDAYLAKSGHDTGYENIDLSFHLLRNGKDFCDKTTLKDPGTCTNPIVEMTDLKPQDGVSVQQVIQALPKYDGDGAKYEYRVAEEATVPPMGRVIYSYDSYDKPDGTPATYDNVLATVTNTPPGKGTAIPVRKEWLDGQDIQHRENVIVRLYKKAATSVDDYEKAGDGTPRQVILSYENGWEDLIGLKEGESREDFMVREYYIGSDSNPTASNVTYTNFAAEDVIHGEASATNHLYDVKTTMSGSTCVITNIRKAQLSVELNKTWVDGAGTDRPNATFQLEKWDIGGSPVTVSGAEVTLDGTADATETTPWEYTWKNLDKYDEKGELYTYSVAETKVGSEPVNGGSVTVGTGEAAVTYSATVDGGTYHFGEKQHNGDKIVFSSSNTKVGQVRDFKVHKIWRDDNEQDGVKRPDIFLTLYRTYDSRTGVKTREEVPGYIDRKWAKPTDYHWYCTFDPLPKYNGQGYEYTYSVVEGSHSWGDYKGFEKYYKETPTGDELDTTDLTPIGPPVPGEPYAETYHEGTIVNQRGGETHVEGRKIWTDMGGLSLANYPTVTIELHSYAVAADSTNPGNITYTDLGAVLKPGGTDKYTATVSGNAPEYDFTDFPKYDEKTGKRIYYGLVETEIKDSDGNIVSLEENIFERVEEQFSFVINNKWKATGDYQVKATKKWDIPADMTVNGEKYEYPDVTVNLVRQFAKADNTTPMEGYAKQNVASKVLKTATDDSGTVTIDVAEFKNLPEFAPNGRVYLYTLEEEPVPGYESTIEKVTTPDAGVSIQFKITNKYKATDGEDYTDIKGTKTWQDAQEPDLRPTDPAEIGLKLYRYSAKNGSTKKEHMDKATLTWTAPVTGDTWTYQFAPGAGQPFLKNAPDGTAYTYVVEETMPTDNQAYEMVSGSFNAGTGTYNFTNRLKTTSLKLTKTWNDSENKYASRPNSIQVKVERRLETDTSGPWAEFKIDGKEEQTVSTIGTTEWVYIIKNLPQMNKAGEKWQYHAREISVDSGYKGPAEEADYTDAYDGTGNQSTTEFTNALITDGGTVNLKVNKVWADGNNKDGLRPEELSFTLIRDGNELTSAGVLKLNVTTGAWTPSDTWENLPKYQNGTTTPSVYSVKESGHNETLYIPTQAQTSNSDGSGKTVTVTNTHEPIMDVSVAVEKVWASADDWDVQPNEITVGLYRKEAGATGDPEKVEGKTITLKADGDPTKNWKGKFTDLPYGDGKKEYVYSVKEEGVPGYTPKLAVTAGTVGADGFAHVDPAAASHEIGYKLTNTQNVTSLKVTKTWDDTGAEFLRPDTVTVGLWRKLSTEADAAYAQVKKSGGADFWTEKISKASDGSYTPASFVNLPTHDKSGAAYDYQARETKVGTAADAAVIVDGKKFIGGYQVTEVTTPPTGADSPWVTAVTNKIAPAVKITIQKVWDDDGNRDGLRPAAIVVELYKDGTPVDSQTIQAAGSWRYTWKELPKYQNDGATPCAYTVKEKESTAGDLTPYGGAAAEVSVAHGTTGTLTNTYTPKTMSVTAEKVWANDSANPALRPGSITLELQQTTTPADVSSWTPIPSSSGTAKQMMTGTGAVGWTPVVWSNLPIMQNETGTGTAAGTSQPISYRVVESSVPRYDSAVTGPVAGDIAAADNAKTITVTNTLNGETEAKVIKKWVDGGSTGIRGDVTNTSYQLQRKFKTEADTAYKDVTESEVGYSGADKVTCTLSAQAADQTHTFGTLPRYDTVGQEYVYRVVETSMKLKNGTVLSPDAAGILGSYEGAAAFTPGNPDADQGSTTTISNTELTSFSVIKYWEGDDEWKDETRPDRIEVQLYKMENGSKQPVGMPVTLTESTGWTYQWDNIPKYENTGSSNVLIKYVAEEVGGAGYEAVASGSNAIKNTLKTTSLEVEKKWDDQGDYYNTRPDTVEVKLQRRLVGVSGWADVSRGTASAVMSQADNWQSVTFIGLPTWNKDGKQYEYRAVETYIGGEPVTSGGAGGYHVKYENTPNVDVFPGSTVITNTLNSGTLSVTKLQSGGSSSDEFSFQVVLKNRNADYGIYRGSYKVFDKDADLASGAFTAMTADTGEIKLKGGQKFCIEGIPAGTEYTVTETAHASYDNTSKSGENGTIIQNQTAAVSFTNTYKSPGGGGGNPGGGGGGGNPGGGGGGNPPGGPGVETTPAVPTNPSVPEVPGVPGTPGDPIPPGSIVEIVDPLDPDGPPLYHGPYDPNGRYPEIPPGTYTIVTIGEDGTPLASYKITIDDDGVPLGIPMVGDHSVPAVLLAALLLISSMGVVIVWRRKKENENQEKEG